MGVCHVGGLWVRRGAPTTAEPAEVHRHGRPVAEGAAALGALRGDEPRTSAGGLCGAQSAANTQRSSVPTTAEMGTDQEAAVRDEVAIWLFTRSRDMTRIKLLCQVLTY